MKTIELADYPLSLEEMLNLAGEEGIILRTEDGRIFMLAEVDDFGQEVELTRQNEALMQFLDERSNEAGMFTLEQIRAQLA
jgi:hypothetical protein